MAGQKPPVCGHRLAGSIASQMRAADALMQSLKAEGVEPVIDYQMKTVQDGKRMIIHEVYLDTGDILGGTTIHLLEYIPAD